LALLGIWQGAREVLAQGRLHPDWLQALAREAHLRDAGVNGISWSTHPSPHFGRGNKKNLRRPKVV
jgi:hypothetical protein